MRNSPSLADSRIDDFGMRKSFSLMLAPRTPLSLPVVVASWTRRSRAAVGRRGRRGRRRLAPYYAPVASQRRRRRVVDAAVLQRVGHGGVGGAAMVPEAAALRRRGEAAPEVGKYRLHREVGRHVAAVAVVAARQKRRSPRLRRQASAIGARSGGFAQCVGQRRRVSAVVDCKSVSWRRVRRHGGLRQSQPFQTLTRVLAHQEVSKHVTFSLYVFAIHARRYNYSALRLILDYLVNVIN